MKTLSLIVRIVALALPMILIGLASGEPPEKPSIDWGKWWWLGVLLSPLPAAIFILYLVGSRQTWPDQPRWHRPEMRGNLFSLSTMYDVCPFLHLAGLIACGAGFGYLVRSIPDQAGQDMVLGGVLLLNGLSFIFGVKLLAAWRPEYFLSPDEEK